MSDAVHDHAPDPGHLPLLVLLNGAPGVGKSTLAARFVDRHPLALNLDVDLVRSLLGGWTRSPGDAGVAARRLALAMAASHLAEGLDVLIPQYVAVDRFADALQRLAHGRATFHHVLLRGDPAVVRVRLAGRPDDGTREPLDDTAFDELLQRLEEFSARRPEVVSLDALGDVDSLHAQLVSLLGPARDRGATGAATAR